MSACSWLCCQDETPEQNVLTPTGSLFSAETWISNRALLLALRCLECVAASLCLFRLDRGSWLCVFSLGLKLWGIEDKFASECELRFVLSTLATRKAHLWTCPRQHWSVYLQIPAYVRVLRSSGIQAVTLWSSHSRGKATLPVKCCCKQWGDFCHQWQSQSL